MIKIEDIIIKSRNLIFESNKEIVKYIYKLGREQNKLEGNITNFFVHFSDSPVLAVNIKKSLWKLPGIYCYPYDYFIDIVTRKLEHISNSEDIYFENIVGEKKDYIVLFKADKKVKVLQNINKNFIDEFVYDTNNIIKYSEYENKLDVNKIYMELKDKIKDNKLLFLNLLDNLSDELSKNAKINKGNSLRILTLTNDLYGLVDNGDGLFSNNIKYCALFFSSFVTNSYEVIKIV